MVSRAYNYTNELTYIFIHEMKKMNQKQKDGVIWVKDWWSTNFETIPEDSKQTIVIDNRPKEIPNLVK